MSGDSSSGERSKWPIRPSSAPTRAPLRQPAT